MPDPAPIQPSSTWRKTLPGLGRIADQIQRDLADLIRTELKDPRVGMVTLTGVEVSNDYHHAKVFFTTLGDAEIVRRRGTACNAPPGFLRSQLAGGLKLRIVPELHFVHDESVERGMRSVEPDR